MIVGSPLTTSSLTASIGALASLTASWGAFSGLVTNVFIDGSEANRTVGFDVLGVFVPGNGTPNLSAFTSGPMSLTFSATQTGGAAASISASYTIASPPVGVPEPVSLGLVGLALAGACFATLRRA